MSETAAPCPRACTAILLFALLLSEVASFQIPMVFLGARTVLPSRSQSSLHAASKSSSSLLEEAAKLKAQAERIRLEAEQQDAALTLSKIESLENKLGDEKWLAKHPDEEPLLVRQMQDLTKRLNAEKKPPPVKSVKTTTPSVSVTEPSAEISSSSKPSSDLTKLQVPEYGFDQKELDLYLPIAKEIENRMPNATIEEKLDAFRESPELQNHFRSKIEEMFLAPLKELQKLEYLKGEFMSSTSSSKKDQLKREIKDLDSSMAFGSFQVCNSIYKELSPLTEEYVEARVKAISSLPPVMQAFYKKRVDVDLDCDLRLAIELDHYDPQLQLLEQLGTFNPLTEEQRSQALQALASLSPAVRDRFAKEQGLENGNDTCAILKKLEGPESAWPLRQAMDSVPDSDIYTDLEFQDRSRWVEEMIPALTRMESCVPTKEQMDVFYSKVLDKNTFAPLSKPERVKGGYYIRGQNRFQSERANDKLVDALRHKLAASPLADKVQVFYILDPSPATDEEIEFGEDIRPVLFVTGVDPKLMYDTASPWTKGLVSASSLAFIVSYALGAYGLNDVVMDQLQTAVNSGEADLSSFVTDLVAPIALSVGAIQLTHEVAHRIVAWKDKFEVGWPNFVPSVQLGLTGAITPLKSPPRNLKSLFDFAIAGPLTGMAVSLILFGIGLQITAAMDLAQQTQLPVLPVPLIKSSSLLGGMTEAFLGSGTLLSPNLETALLPLHPFAIAGVAGVFTNALSLLPLGNTDGGRIAISMFGRRGTYIVKTLTTLLIVSVGLFGLDESRLLLLYALFTGVWQRELEAPSFNEVDELDFQRGLVAIGTALLVALTLVPML